MFKSIAKVAGNVLKTNAGKGAVLFGTGAIAGSALESNSSGSGSNSSGSGHNNNNKNDRGMFSETNMIIIFIVCIFFYFIGHKIGLF